MAELTENLKYFFYGLLLGSKQMERVKAPVDVPITSIQLSYEKADIRPEESILVEALVLPVDATFRNVEWSSSDIDVVIVNKISENTAVIRGVNSGSAVITCTATDGYGASAQVNINVLDNVRFETLELPNRNIVQYHENQFVGATAFAFNYTPLDADGSKIRLVLDNPYNGDESPYTVRDTIFDNIKLVVNSWPSLDLNTYSSTNNSRLGYNVDATDGSGIQLLNKYLTTNNTNLQQALYGCSGINTRTATKNLEVGYSMYLFDGNNRLAESFSLNNISIDISGDNCISIDNQYVVTATSTGTAIVNVVIGYYYTFTFTFNCVASAANNSTPTFVVVDEKGQSSYNAWDGWFEGLDSKFRIVAYNKGIKITGLVASNTSQADIDGEWVIPKGVGAITIRVTYERLISGGTSSSTTNVTFYIRTNEIACGTITSEYLKEGIAIWVRPGASYPSFSNGLNAQKIDMVLNANEARIVDQMIAPPNIPTLTYNADGKNKRQYRTSAGNTNIYQIEKLTSGDVTIRFQLRDYPSVYDEVVI